MKINKKRASLWSIIALEAGLIGGLVGYNLAPEAQAADVELKQEIVELKSDYAYTDYRSLGEFVITHYCACEKCTDGDGITATGTKATEGRTIAVDPEVIPYGTIVIIDGHTYVAEDCGGAIKGNKIDIYMDSHRAALEAGVKVVEVFEEV